MASGAIIINSAYVFWRRWTREYLPILQQRSKWSEKRRNLEVGNVVLLVNDGFPIETVDIWDV